MSPSCRLLASCFFLLSLHVPGCPASPLSGQSYPPMTEAFCRSLLRQIAHADSRSRHRADLDDSEQPISTADFYHVARQSHLPGQISQLAQDFRQDLLDSMATTAFPLTQPADHQTEEAEADRFLSEMSRVPTRCLLHVVGLARLSDAFPPGHGARQAGGQGGYSVLGGALGTADIPTPKTEEFGLSMPSSLLGTQGAKMADGDVTQGDLTSSKRAYRGKSTSKSASKPRWMTSPRHAMSKRPHHRMSINNAFVNLKDMLVARSRQRVMRNRANMRYLMYAQG